VANTGEGAVGATTLTQSQVVATGSSAGALTLTLDNGDIVNYFRIHGVL
jgi:flagellar basal-body rod modification protein FlgD